jgi:AraC-like DNA-binding protein
MIFVNRGSLQLAQDEHMVQTLPRAFLVGPMENSHIACWGGAVSIWGIRFKPHGASAFLQFPIEGVTNQHVQLKDVWEPALGLSDLLSGSLQPGSSPNLIDSFLLEQRINSDLAPSWLAELVRQIRQTDTPLTISNLARAANLSSRQMERQFRKYIGLSPKKFCRIMRFRLLLPHIKSPREPNWADLAVLGGFYDQAHLVHNCVALTGVAPRQLWREFSMSYFYNTRSRAEANIGGK